MGRLLPILALVALLLGILAATLVGGVGLVAAAVYGIVAAVFLIVTRERDAMIAGGVAIILLVLAMFGLIGGVSIEEGGVDFPLGAGGGTALLIAGLAAFVAGVLVLHWRTLDPDWLGWVGAGALLVAAVLAFVDRGGLGSPGATVPTVVALLLLVAAWPVVVAMKEPHEHGRPVAAAEEP